jgi:hypothetical protein
LHELVELIACLVLVSFVRPKVTAFDFMAVGLVLVDPPVAYLVACDAVKWFGDIKCLYRLIDLLLV